MFDGLKKAWAAATSDGQVTQEEIDKLQELVDRSTEEMLKQAQEIEALKKDNENWRKEAHQWYDRCVAVQQALVGQLKPIPPQQPQAPQGLPPTQDAAEPELLGGRRPARDRGRAPPGRPP